MFNQFHLLLLSFWLIWVALHSLMAGIKFKQKVETLMGSNYRYYRLLYSFFAAVTLACILVYQFSKESPLIYKPGVIHYVIAIPLMLFGMIVMGICIKKYFLNLSGIDVFVKTAKPGSLEKTGLHAYVRHPLYSGTLLFVWAVLILFPTIANLIAAVIITGYTLIGIKMEERKLLLEFGDSYKSYAASVPMLIPGFRR